MRILVTGAQGFVGRHLVAARRAAGPRGEVVPSSRTGGIDPTLGSVEAMDIVDTAAVDSVVARVRPTHVVHLAGLSVIAAAAEDAALAWRIHLLGTLNIANAIKRHVPQCVLLFAGSGQVYGKTGQSGLSLDEDALLAPTNVQMASKAAADLALGALADEGLRCLRFRPFNHTGPHQSDKFAVPNFAMQVARIAAGLQPPLIRVGNLDAERDFLDVRDVVAAYLQAIDRSDRLKSGTIFNVASGIPRRIGDLLNELIRMSGVAVEIQSDSGRMRPSDIPRFIGDASRARQLLEWQPAYALETTLREILDLSLQAVGKSTGASNTR